MGPTLKVWLHRNLPNPVGLNFAAPAQERGVRRL